MPLPRNVTVNAQVGAGGSLVVSDQTLSIGADNTSGSGDYAFSASTGTILSIGPLSGANAADFTATLSGEDVLISPAAALSGPYSLTLSCYSEAGQSGDQDFVALTITVEADTYYAYRESDLLAATNTAYVSTAAPKTIKLRKNNQLLVWDDDFFDTAMSNTGLITVTSEDVSSPDEYSRIVATSAADVDARMSNLGNIEFVQMEFHNEYDRTVHTATNLGIQLFDAWRSNVAFRQCKFTGTPWSLIGPGPHFRGLLGTETVFNPLFDLTIENCLFTDSRRGRGMRYAAPATGGLYLKNNLVRNISVDGLNLDGVPDTVEITGEIFEEPFTDRNRTYYGTGFLTNAGPTGEADAKTAVIYIQTERDDVIGAEETIVSHAGLTVKRLATGLIEVRALDTGAASAVVLTSNINMNSFRRGVILAAIDTDGTSQLYVGEEGRLGAWIEDSIVTATTAGETLDFTGAAQISEAGVEEYNTRVAIWEGITVPDISQQSVRDNFFYSAGNGVDQWAGYSVPRSVSVAAYGNPIIDIGGDFHDVRTNNGNQGTGGVFTSNGVVEADHGDMWQTAPREDASNFLFAGNFGVSGRYDALRGTQFDDPEFQGFFNEDVTAAFNANIVIRNCYYAGKSFWAAAVSNPNNGRITGCTLVYNENWTQGNEPFGSFNDHNGGTAIGTNVISGVVASGVTDEFAETLTNNIEAPFSEVGANSWANLYTGDGAGNFDPETRQEFHDFFVPLPGGPLLTAPTVIGALGSHTDFDLGTSWELRNPTETDLYP